MNGQITYSYQPADWDQKRFLELGGFVVVFLNYNKIRFVDKSVRCALDQDFPLLEMFFMDNASTDGSGDRIEAIVRQYRGRHKVSVVRNAEDQYITGQWNIVKRLATGNWFGMFCADDFAHPDRVSIVAERLAKYPTLRGIATAAVDINPDTGIAYPDSHYVPQPYFAHGKDAWADLQKHFAPNGSTSFWHKSVLADEIPRVPLDDAYFLLRLYAINRGNAGPVFLYDSSVKTIDYSLGVGICGGGVSSKESDSPRRKWVLKTLQYKRFLAKMATTLSAAIEYACAQGNTQYDVAPFTGHLIWCRLRSQTTLARLIYIPRFCHDLRSSGLPQSLIRFTMREFAYYLLFECFGLNVAYLLKSIVRKV